MGAHFRVLQLREEARVPEAQEAEQQQELEQDEIGGLHGDGGLRLLKTGEVPGL